MRRIIFILLVLLTISISGAFCGPFGLDMGMSLDRVRQVSSTTPANRGNDLYEITPPNTNNMFETYVVRIHPTYGVYLIKAVGVDITTNGYGTALRTAFNNLAGSLERVYGQYRLTDFLLPRSIWKDPDDFMMGLLRNERYLFAMWERKEGSNLPDDLESIAIGASALNSSKGYVSLEYYSIDYEKIKAEEQQRQDSVF